jgi:hypothetical protein
VIISRHIRVYLRPDCMLGGRKIGVIILGRKFEDRN